MEAFVNRPVDPSVIGLRDPVCDSDFDAYADRLRIRFGVDAVLITIIDDDEDRQVIKGNSAPKEPWSAARQTPLSQSLCKIVVGTEDVLRVDDVETQIPPDQSTAFLHLGVKSYLGVPLCDDSGTAIGALCLITTDAVRSWTDAEEQDLSLFADTLNQTIALRQMEYRVEAADREVAAQLETAGEKGLEFDALTRIMPGVTFRYALFEDGTDAIEYVSEGCAELYGFTEEELAGDPTLIWGTILPEDLDEMIRSVTYSAQNLAPWCHDFRIRTRDGILRHLRGYGHPEALENGVGVFWQTLIVNLDQIAEDAQRNSPLAPPAVEASA